MPRDQHIVIALTIYSRPGCHLCEDMKPLVAQVVDELRMPACMEEINIANDPELEARYGTEIPVLLVDGKKAAKYRVTKSELLRVLRRDRPLGGMRQCAAWASLPSCVRSGSPRLATSPSSTKCPRRFCCQQASFSSVQKGASLPLLTTVMRAVGTPRLTR